MRRALLTSAGNTIEVVRELGRGGEGSVFALSSGNALVAKLYHSVLDVRKQAKLRHMAQSADEELKRYVAWPVDTLHLTPAGPVTGFLMKNVHGYLPAHSVYSPADRLRQLPGAGWDFLLFVARNAAAAFDTLHARGHVVGDVNQGNLLVAPNSTVVLIDSDSFQIQGRSELYLCEVGVSHFTPPELQGLSSFRGQARTPNHDRFGLAVLIFHLLFGGRHPFSGVPLARSDDETLEASIKAYRFAYALDHLSRGIAPPPRSVGLEIVTPRISALFGRAFTEEGAGRGRPSASEWQAALDEMRANLFKCSRFAYHRYSSHVAQCPWCRLEAQGVKYFGSGHASAPITVLTSGQSAVVTAPGALAATLAHTGALASVPGAPWLRALWLIRPVVWLVSSCLLVVAVSALWMLIAIATLFAIRALEPLSVETAKPFVLGAAAIVVALALRALYRSSVRAAARAFVVRRMPWAVVLLPATGVPPSVLHGPQVPTAPPHRPQGPGTGRPAQGAAPTPVQPRPAMSPPPSPPLRGPASPPIRHPPVQQTSPTKAAPSSVPRPQPAPPSRQGVTSNAQPAGAKTQGYSVVGNAESLKFHRYGCEWAQKMSRANRRTFASSAAARAAGFKACRTCWP
jgi:hypothetical protein